MIVHGKRKLSLMKTPTPLFVLSPNHGKTEYLWERKGNRGLEWTKIDVPSHTCLLYVDVAGEYKCTVESISINFHVQGK